MRLGLKQCAAYESAVGLIRAHLFFNTPQNFNYSNY
jgi:hypothetical protein